MKKIMFLLVFVLSFGISFADDPGTPKEPCSPESPCNNNWTTNIGAVYQISPTCKLVITFASRVCSNTNPFTYQIQITGVRLVGDDCPPIPESLQLIMAFQAAADKMNMEIGWPPENMYDCNDYWEFSIVSCWVTLVYSHPFPDGPWKGLKQILVPCEDAGCCQQKIQACKINGGVSLKRIGNPTGTYYICKDAKFPDISLYPEPDVLITTCIPHCDDFLGIPPVGGKFNKGENPTPRKAEIDPKVIEDAGISISISENSNSNITIKFEAKKESNLTVLLSDIKGIALVSYNLDIVTGTTSKDIDVSKYSSGTYLVNIYFGDKLIKTEKVLINK